MQFKVLGLLVVSIALSLIVIGLYCSKGRNEHDLDNFFKESGWTITTNVTTDSAIFFDHPQKSTLVAEFAKPYVAFSASTHSKAEDLLRVPTLARSVKFISLANSENLSRNATNLLRFFPKARILAVHESISETELRKLLSNTQIIDIWVISPERFLEVRNQFGELRRDFHNLEKRLIVRPQIQVIRL